MENRNEHDLITALKENGCELSRKELYDIIQSIEALILQELKNGNQVTLNRFVTFTMVEHAARKARNPRTGEPIEVPAKRVVKLIPRKNLLELTEVLGE